MQYIIVNKNKFRFKNTKTVIYKQKYVKKIINMTK